MLEQKIDELIAAIVRATEAVERQTKALGGSIAPAPAATATTEEPKKIRKAKTETAPVTPPAQEAPKQPAGAITLDTLRAVADQLLSAGKQPFVYELVRKYGVENLRTLDTSRYAEVHAAMLAELAGKTVKVEAAPEVKVETPKVETPKQETPKQETPKVETPKVEKKPEPEFTKSALIDLGQRLLGLGYAREIKAVAVECGAERLSLIPEASYPKAFAALTKLENEHVNKAA